MISLCIITKDNEKTIADCIKSVKAIVGEIIVVDTGSTDKTKEICVELGAKVYDFEWKDNFSEAKNFALEKATGSWILALDADETIAEKDLAKISQLTANEKIAGYYLTQRNYTNEIGSFSWVSSKDDEYKESKAANGFVPRKMLRFFRNDKRIRFQGVIHDSVINSINQVGGFLAESDIPIHHYGLLDRGKERTERYIEIEKQNIKDDYFQEYQIASQLHSLGRLNEAVEHLAKSIELNPNFYLSLLELAIISIKKGKVSEARPLLLQSLKLQQKDMAWSHLGIVEAYEKNYEKAIACFHKAIEMNPKNADLYYNLGNAYTQAGRKGSAKDAFEKAAYLNPDYRGKVKL